MIGRRAFLRGTGAVGVLGTAGCSAVLGGGDDPSAIPATRLRSIAADGSPAIPETIPVDLEAAFLQNSADAVRSILRSVPTPLTAQEIPNGVVREHVSSTVDRARSYLHGAEEADSTYEALRRVRWARGEARSAAAAWAAVDSGLTRGQVVNRGPDLIAAADAFGEEWRYVGDAPVPAALVHAVLEQWIRGARNRATIGRARLRREPENPITIGELAGDLGEARAAIDQSRYVYRRFLDSLSGANDLLQVFQLAGGTLTDAVRDRRRSLPEVDDPAELVDGEASPVALEALERLYAEATQLEDAEHARAEGRPARGVVLAQPVLARLRAVEHLRDRVADGESIQVVGGDDVRRIRAGAIEAVRAAREATSEPLLTDWALADLVDDLRRADNDLADSDGSVRVEFLRFPLSEYLYVEAIARGLPQTSAQVAAALRQG